LLALGFSRFFRRHLSSERLQTVTAIMSALPPQREADLPELI
jgi:hypothetical protein